MKKSAYFSSYILLKGASTTIIAEVTGISRATYFRHKKILKDLEKGILPPSKKPRRLNKPKWGESEKQMVLRLRRENPTYGKDKIAVILKRDHGVSLSSSTVGRILTFLKQKGLILTSLSAIRSKRKRHFKGHAKAWTFKDYKDMKLGERVQIDHMTVTKNGVCLKEFHAWERMSKYVDAAVYSNASSRSAKKFLESFVKKAPFEVLSIQVDGGSEFMAEFEEACRKLKIPLEVLPPKKPKYNGGVERSNRIFKEEFYARKDILADSIGAFNAEIKTMVHKYNTYRPHSSLKGLTPIEYIKNTLSEAQTQSHII